MARKKIHLSVDNHDRLGGPRVQSREANRKSVREAFGIIRGRRLTKDVAGDLGIIRGRDLAAQVLKAEEERR